MFVAKLSNDFISVDTTTYAHTDTINIGRLERYRYARDIPEIYLGDNTQETASCDRSIY